MAEENLDLSQRAEFNRPGTTDVKSFLAFGGEDVSPNNEPVAIRPEQVPVTLNNKSLPNETTTLPQFPVKDTVIGFDPFNKDQLAKTPGSVGQGLAKQLQKDLSNLDSREHYSKTYMYDASATGAHKARYKAYGQSTYDKIGFNPEINNEDLFNENTSMFDDYVRMATNSAFPMLTQGLFANPKSYAQIFQGNIGQDLDASEQYEEWNAIGYSSKGGLGGFFNNAINSVAYSAGIMLESVAEYALIGAIEGSLVGPEGTAGGAIAGGALGAVKGLAAVPKALFNMGKYGGKMLTNLKNLEKFTEAKALFNAASKTTFNFVNPVNNTFEGIKAAQSGDNLTALARTAKTAGGFFRDVIGMNMALSEGRLEGGFVENNTYQKLYDEYWKREGKAPDVDTQVRMKKRAKIAGAQDTFKNAALVFYSNKLAFNNLVEGKFMAGASGKVREVGKEFDVIFTAAKEKGLKGTYELVDYNFKNALKGFVQPKNFGKATLNYFKTNVVEGAQEVLQDVIAKSTEDYYVNSFYDPSKANNDYSMATLGNAFGHQVTAEGFETFMSGFVMGGLLKPFGGAVPRYAGVLYNKYMMDPVEYEDYINTRKSYGQNVVNAMNNMTSDPVEFFKQRYVNLGVQSKVNTVLADEDSTTKEKHDAVDTSFLSDVLTTLNAGTFKTWLYNFKKMGEMSDRDLEETYKLKEGDGAKLRENINEYVEKAKGLQARHNYAKDQLADKKFKLQNFQEGTPEYEKAAIYNQAIDTALYNLTFLSETFDLNLERSNKIVQRLSKSKIFSKLPGADVQTIIEHDKLISSIGMLEEEIKVLRDTGTTQATNQANQKEELLKRLVKFQETQIEWFETKATLQALESVKKEKLKSGLPEDQSELEAYDEMLDIFKEGSVNPIEAHKEAFMDLLKHLSGSDVNFATAMRQIDKRGNVENTLFEDLTDIYNLTLENKNIIPYVNLLNNRAGFYDHVERNFQWMRNMWLNRQNYYKEIVDQSIKMKENNALLKTLADDNIYVDLDQFAEWVEDPSVLPEYFIDASKGSERIIPKGSYLYDKYIETFERVARMQEMAAAGDPVDLDGQLEEAISDLMAKKDNEIQAATVSFKSNIQQETGSTFEELQEQQKAQEERKQSLDKTANTAKIKDIEKFLKTLEISDPNKVVDLIKAFLKSNVVSQEVLNEDVLQDYIDEISADPDLLRSEVLPIAQKYPESYGDESRFIAAMRAYGVQKILSDEISSLSIEETDVIAEEFVDPIKETKSWKDYQKELADLDAKYEKLLAELTAEFTKKGLSTATVQELDVVTTTTPWSEIEKNHPRLFAILNKNFQDEVITQMGISQSDDNFEQIRNNWLETQGETINNYNAEVASEKVIQQQRDRQFKKPEFKYYKLPKSFGEITENSKITPLSTIRDGLQSMLDTGVRLSGKKTIKLKPAEIEKIKNDVQELNRVINWLRQYGVKEISQKYEKYIEIFNERIRKRKSEIEEIRDENGRLIERRIDGKPVTNRVTKEAEALAIELTPGKEPFLYYGLKPQPEDILDTEGNVVETIIKPAEIQAQYDAIMEDDAIAAEDKLDSFMLAFRNFAMRSKTGVFKNAANTNINEEKFNLLRKSLEADFSKENLVKTIQDLAYKHSSDVGIILDDLIKDFLTFEGADFKKITKPEKVSQEAFDALFSTVRGKEGIITKFRDGVIDGNYVIIGASDLLFDKSLFENGLVGETDLIAINENGDFEIIDVKALAKSTWDSFDADIKLDELKEKLRADGLSEEEILQNKDVKKLTTTLTTYSRKLYYRLQQSVYANLFYNMTGIMPKRISLLPIEVKIDNEGNLLNASLSSLLKQDYELSDEEKEESSIRTLELEYAEESQRIVPLKKPEFKVEESEVVEPTEEMLVEDIQKSDLLKDNIGEWVIFNGRTGKLQFRTEGLVGSGNGYYLVNFGNVVQDLEYNQKRVYDGNIEFSSVGVTPIRKTQKVGQIRKINGKRIDAKILGYNNALINGVNFRLNRNEEGQIVSMTYRVNDQEIADLQEEIEFYQADLQRLAYDLEMETAYEEGRENNPLSPNINDPSIREAATYRIEIARLKRKIEELKEDNPQRTMRGGNFNDYIFALNSLPESFKLLKGKNSTDEKNDLKEIERLSSNPGVAIQIDEIFNKNYPEELDKLLEEGVSKITEDELSNIYKWSNDVILDLTILGSRLAVANKITDDVDNQINAMYELLNDLELIKLTKDGKIDRRSTKSAEKAFGPKKVQDRAGLSKDEESTSGQAKGVPGQKTGKKPTIDELKNAINASRFNEEDLLSGLSTEENVENSKEADKLIAKIDNAKTLEQLETAYAKALEYLQNNPTKISPTDIASAQQAKLDELTVSVEETSLEENTYLLPKTAIFDHAKIEPVIFKKRNKDGTMSIQDVISGKTQNVKEEELENFVRMTPEAIEELNNKVQLTEEEKQEFNKNLVAATEVLKNSTALDGVASQVEEGATTGGFLSALTSKKCNT
jgi:hypothetical protein